MGISNYDERIGYIEAYEDLLAEAKGYSQDYVDFLKEYAAREEADWRWDEIRYGLMCDIDCSLCVSSPLDWHMALIDKAAEANGYSQDYVDFLKDFARRAEEDQWDEISDDLIGGRDVSRYADTKFDCAQMMQVKAGLGVPVDVSWYADPAFDAYQMCEIRQGLEAGVDVSAYARPDLDWQQMRDVRETLLVAERGRRLNEGITAASTRPKPQEATHRRPGPRR